MLRYQSVRLGLPLRALLNCTRQEIQIGNSFISRTMPRTFVDLGSRNFHLCRPQMNFHSVERNPSQGSASSKKLSKHRPTDSENNLENIQRKILYNSVLEVRSINSRIKSKIESQCRHRLAAKTALLSINEPDVPIALKYMPGYQEIKQEDTAASPDNLNSETSVEPAVHLPYSVQSERLNPSAETVVRDADADIQLDLNDRGSDGATKWKSWMRDYDVYDERDTDEGLSEQDRQGGEDRPWQLDYGTTDVGVPVSSVPCGGCGALLHCQDTAIPGYLPAELFRGRSPAELRSVTCQRCHFMRHYDTALAVTVGADEYPAVMAPLREKKALAVLVVDLMDFPCSIWPGVLDIIGTKRPVVVVGNKVDLLPQDSPGFLRRMEEVLTAALAESGVGAANVKHVALVSAKTGYGIDQLITKLHTAWEYKGDVYLVGCTNVGKSSLFNALLQSDYCKVKAVDLVQRATTSPWPGTTLNLLKFPIMRPSGVRMYLRTERLKSQRVGLNAERRLRHHRLRTSRQSAALVGHVGRTFLSDTALKESPDPFAVNALGQTGRTNPFGIDPRDRQYAESRWCYDTPGTVHPDQILDLLTTEELMLTLPKRLLHPRTFSLSPGGSVLVAGLARLDYLEGSKAIRFTVFASEGLPLTVCRTTDAEQVYSSLLGSELLAVPAGGAARLGQWPGLGEAAGGALRVTGEDWRRSCADVVLSSAGWVSVTPGPGMDVSLRAWTPGGRGVHVRPPLLPFAVNHRGARIRRSPAYQRGLGLYKTVPV